MAEKQPSSDTNTSVTFTRRACAKNQLERAIYLWFQNYVVDTPSIYTLTVAAQGCLDAECRDRKARRSNIVTEIQKQTDLVRRILTNPQNFFKHGGHDSHGKHKPKAKKDELPFPPGMSDVFIYDNVRMYQTLFGGISQMMVCFTLRFAFENPGNPAFKKTQAAILDRFKLKQPSELGRRGFFEKVLPIVGEFSQGMSLPSIHLLPMPNKGGLKSR